MQATHPAANPFALLLNPAAVFAELERSDRLNRLSSRICRPLDKPAPVSPIEVEDESSSDGDADFADAP